MFKWVSCDFGDFDFSDQVKAEWTDQWMYDKLIKGETFMNPSVELQVTL